MRLSIKGRIKLFRKNIQIYNNSGKRKNRASFIALMLSSVLVLFFQNCSAGHVDTTQTSNSSTSQTDTSVPATPASPRPIPVQPGPTPNPTPLPSPTSFKIISNPMASGILTSTANIEWSLSEVATGQIEYGTSIAYGNLTAPELSFNYSSHKQTISGLNAATTYHFRAISKNAAGIKIISEDFTFKTLASPVVVNPLPSPSPAPTPVPTPPPTSCAASSVTPSIGSQAAWDAKFFGRYGAQGPALSNGADIFAWQGHYWVRAYVSMAKTYGSVKYLDLAVKTIDYWFANQESSSGWGASINSSQMLLDTGVIAQAVTIFSYQVSNDTRFSAYQNKADQYIAKLETILHTYDAQWADNAPYSGSPGFYVYASCGGICSSASLIMYNQGAALAKALLLIDRIKRLKGLTPDPGYLHKADAAAAYFKTFSRLSGNAYVWDYGGARTGTGTEDTSHGHLDLSLLIAARKFNLGGLTNTDMNRLAATMQKIFNGAAGASDVSLRVDGSGTPSSNYDRMSVGYDWIDLADYDSSLLDKTTSVFNKFMPDPGSGREFLGWAEILRKRNCVGL
ncbi:MAG: fibronectin type III domain-containing protein [Pseudobdellovibrio sp.]